MTKGILLWNNRKIRYSQNKNALDNIIKKAFAEQGILRGANWLEFCMVSTFCCNVEGMGLVTVRDYPKTKGLSIQLDDFIAAFLNDPNNDTIFSTGTAFDNRSFRNYKKLYELMFPGKEAVYKKWTWKELTEEVYAGNGLHLCLETPGHGVAGIAYDNSRNIILLSDPNSDSRRLKHGGWHEELTESEFERNVKKYAVVYRM